MLRGAVRVVNTHTNRKNPKSRNPKFQKTKFQKTKGAKGRSILFFEIWDFEI
jgi:hypothetical protein